MEAGGERHRTARTAHTAGRTARGRTRIGVALVMVLCGVLFATTARLSGGGSIRDESSDVVGVLQERGRDIERLTEENATMRAEVEGLRGAEAGAPTAEGAGHIADAVGLSEVSGPALRITLTDAPSSALSIPGTEPNGVGRASCRERVYVLV